jgi:hypothetical protein
MPIEYKHSQKAITLGIDDRTVTGIFCVHGNVDSGDGWSSRDRSHPGLFGDFKAGNRDRAVFLWQHNSNDPPIATIDDLYDVSAADLPPAVRLYAPDATGGVAVKRTYLDTPRGNEVLAGIKASAIREMSYAYDVTRWDYEKLPEGSDDLPVRNIYAADLYDCSDVVWGMNPATSADGTKGRPLVAHGDVVKAAITAYIERVQDIKARREKEGRVFSQANYAALKELADDLDGLSMTLRDLLAQSEPKQRQDVRRLLVEYQRVRATLNGVALS